ncbi:GOLPH3/VPS74 family protein [Pseudonocardia sp. HH130630-07]|uniref:GOLPH3/VPS74 family protein n=1 Tax=Pseudonocardia sp. HH130630-07 TaxID=1690815 RepID=UPI000814FE99|nr:GPP34 family phosphoprotein [Pseudonocardia sp. HH130630-07]ANY07092.1 hypothetical protein AFB00_13250 [Pseudonocardia sp. HH130630-07]
MTLPLPHRLFLLSHDAGKAKLDTNSALVRGPLLRAAAVAELRIAGLVEDRDGKAVRTAAAATSSAGSLDPFLADVLDAVPADRPRRWFGVVDRNWHRAEGGLREQLAADGVITAERRRMLLVFPTHRIGIADPGALRSLRDRVRAPVLEDRDPATADLGDAALAVIAIEGHVSTVFWRRELRAHKQAARALTERVDAELPGLRKALSYSIAARRTPAST